MGRYITLQYQHIVDIPLSSFSKGETSLCIPGERCSLDRNVRKQLLKNSDIVLSEFDTLIAVVIKGIESRDGKVDVHKLSIRVQNFASIRIVNSESVQNDIQSCETVQEIFNVMIKRRLIKFYNFELLEIIINEYLEDHKPKLDEYKLTLKRYFNSRIYELPVYESGGFVEANLKENNNNLVIVADSTWAADYAVEKLFKLEFMLEEILGGSLELVKVVPGSLCISFNAPSVKLDSLAFEENILKLIHFGVAELRKTGYEYSVEIHCKFFEFSSVKHYNCNLVEGKTIMKSIKVYILKHNLLSGYWTLFSSLIIHMNYICCYIYHTDKDMLEESVLPSVKCADWKGRA